MTDPNAPVWCVKCETHLAQPYQKKVCPVCIDKRAKGEK